MDGSKCHYQNDRTVREKRLCVQGEFSCCWRHVTKQIPEVDFQFVTNSSSSGVLVGFSGLSIPSRVRRMVPGVCAQPGQGPLVVTLSRREFVLRDLTV